jgi:hypothetical protein
MAERKTQPSHVACELRIGHRFAPPQEGGRMGYLVCNDDVPPELAEWLKTMKWHPLPERFGAFHLYVDGALVKSTTEVLPADSDEGKARATLLDIDALQADARRGQKQVEGAEQRLAVLQMQVAGEAARLQQVRAELADLEPRLTRERDRVEAAIVRLDTELATHREAVGAAKRKQLEELVEHEIGINKVKELLDNAMASQIATAVALRKNVEEVEATAATHAVTRRVEALNTTNNVLGVLAKAEEGGLLQLTNAGKPSAPRTGDIILGNLNNYLFNPEKPGIETVVEGIGSIVNHFIKPKPPPT